MNRKLLYLFVVVSFFSFVLVSTCLAADTLFSSCDCSKTHTSGDCFEYCTGNYQLNDMVEVFAFYYQRFTGIVGAIALLFFIYGGVLLLVSGGSKENVEKGRKTIVSATIGLVIIFASYLIIGFVFQAFGLDATSWATSGWF